MNTVIANVNSKPLINLIIKILDNGPAKAEYEAAKVKHGEDHPITKAYKGEINQDSALDDLHELVMAAKSPDASPDLSCASPVAIAANHNVSMRKIGVWRGTDEAKAAKAKAEAAKAEAAATKAS